MEITFSYFSFSVPSCSYFIVFNINCISYYRCNCFLYSLFIQSYTISANSINKLYYIWLPALMLPVWNQTERSCHVTVGQQRPNSGLQTSHRFTINNVAVAHSLHHVKILFFPACVDQTCFVMLGILRCTDLMGRGGSRDCVKGNRSLFRLSRQGFGAVMLHCRVPVSRNPLKAKQLALMWSAWLH